MRGLRGVHVRERLVDDHRPVVGALDPRGGRDGAVQQLRLGDGQGEPVGIEGGAAVESQQLGQVERGLEVLRLHVSFGVQGGA